MMVHTWILQRNQVPLLCAPHDSLNVVSKRVGIISKDLLNIVWDTLGVCTCYSMNFSLYNNSSIRLLVYQLLKEIMII